MPVEELQKLQNKSLQLLNLHKNSVCKRIHLKLKTLQTKTYSNYVKMYQKMKKSEVNFMTQQIGVVGLAVMGKNLAWNIESRGYSVSVYNRSKEKVDQMVEESQGKIYIQTIQSKSLQIHQKTKKNFTYGKSW